MQLWRRWSVATRGFHWEFGSRLWRLLKSTHASNFLDTPTVGKSVLSSVTENINHTPAWCCRSAQCQTESPSWGPPWGCSKESVPGSQGEILVRSAQQGPWGCHMGLGCLQQLVPMAPGPPDPILVDGKQAPASCGRQAGRQPSVCPTSGSCTLESPGLQLGVGAPHSELLTGGSV